MKACLRSRDGSCVHQLRQPLTTIGCEGSDVIIQVTSVYLSNFPWRDCLSEYSDLVLSRKRDAFVSLKLFIQYVRAVILDVKFSDKLKLPSLT